MGAITNKDYILGFLNGTSEDYKGRKYKETIQWSDEELEYCHDQVQHVFPLHEESHMAKNFPVLSKEIVEEAKKNEAILNNIKAGAKRFERFFGIGAFKDPRKIFKWAHQGNHNLLRITRIIRCLRLFGLEDEAREFYDDAIEVAHNSNVSLITLSYWKLAMEDDVWNSLRG